MRIPSRRFGVHRKRQVRAQICLANEPQIWVKSRKLWPFNDGHLNVRKWFFLAGIGLVIGLAGCKKNEVTDQPAEAPSVATPAPSAPAPAPTVSAPPVSAPAPATPAPVVQATPAPQLAPPGVFYLVKAVSIETSDGILGLKPGQLLREIRPGVYRADTNEVTLRPEQVTNDMGLARRLMTQDQAVQTALRQQLAAPAPPPVGSTALTATSRPNHSTQSAGSGPAKWMRKTRSAMMSDSTTADHRPATPAALCHL